MTSFRYNSKITGRPFYLNSCLMVRYFSITSIKAGKIYGKEVEDQQINNNYIQKYSFSSNNVNPVIIYERECFII